MSVAGPVAAARSSGRARRRKAVRLVLFASPVVVAAALRFSAFAAKPVEVKVARVERGSVEQTVTKPAQAP